MSRKDGRRHPAVFISYSHESEDHAEKVLAFANTLWSEGIDVMLDQYESWAAEGGRLRTERM